MCTVASYNVHTPSGSTRQGAQYRKWGQQGSVSVMYLVRTRHQLWLDTCVSLQSALLCSTATGVVHVHTPHGLGRML